MSNPTFTLTIEPNAQYASYYADITAAFNAASSIWSRYISGYGSIDVRLNIVDLPGGGATGGAVTSVIYRQNAGIDVLEEGTIHEIRTGIDPNGADYDIVINIDPNDLSDNLWFSPTPADSSRFVPHDRTDAITVLLHELGHGLGFNGWRDSYTTQLPSTYMSTFDANVISAEGIPYFTGSEASRIYGGSVPLTLGNMGHYGNSSGPGSDLLTDLMNGDVYNGETYYPSALDFAILKDVGLTVVRPGADTASRGGAGTDTLTGTSLADTILGFSGNDTILGLEQSDWLEGGDGDDVLLGGLGDDILNGGFRTDTASYAGTSGPVFASIATGLSSGSAGVDTLVSIENLTGGSGGDNLTGNWNDNILDGGDGADTLSGANGSDTLIGGRGRDTHNGGAGADIFDFNLATESSVGPLRDIVYFSHAEGDRIDLRTIDAVKGAGNQRFHWVEKGDLDASFTGEAGELRFSKGILSCDTDGNRRPDMEIKIIGSFTVGDVLL